MPLRFDIFKLDRRTDEPMRRVQENGATIVKTRGGPQRERETQTCRGRINQEQFVEAVAKFVAERTGVNAHGIQSDFDLINTGLLDSISLMELLFFIQITLIKNFQWRDRTCSESITPLKLYGGISTRGRRGMLV